MEAETDTTARLALPFLMPAQAQKHVTYNEAMQRIDMLAQLTVKSSHLTIPPTQPAEGDAYIIAKSATQDWLNNDNKIALWRDKKWVFITQQEGFRVWDMRRNELRVYLRGEWRSAALPLWTIPEGMRLERVQLEMSTSSKTATITTIPIIPAGSLLVGLTGRVVRRFGTVATFSLGVSGDTSRFHSGVANQTGQAIPNCARAAYYSEKTPLVLTANSGKFSTGAIKFWIYALRFDVPT